jgi:hypothetical protein
MGGPLRLVFEEVATSMKPSCRDDRPVSYVVIPDNEQGSDCRTRSIATAEPEGVRPLSSGYRPLLLGGHKRSIT